MSRKKEILEKASKMSKVDAKDVLDAEKKRQIAKSSDTRLQGRPDLDPYTIGKKAGNPIRQTYLDIPKEKWDKIFGKKTKQKNTNKKT